MKTIDDFIKNINNKKNNLSKFLTEEEQILLKKYNNKIFFPEFCERKRALIYNDQNGEYDINDYITVFKVEYNKKFGNINHRDVLGSLMGLGIKRECIGDIVVTDNIYFFTIKEMENYILNNLITIGRVNVSLIKVSIEEINNINFDNYIEDTIIVSSYRLDNIISERCALSREKAKIYINLKNVKINGVINTNPDYIVKINDLISIHKYGRLIIKEEVNKTKKDKYVLRVLKTK